MQIAVKDISEGEKQTEFKLDIMSVSGLFEDAADICGVSTPLSLKCRYMRCGSEIVLDASYKVQLKLNCINCLDDFTYGLDSSFRYVLRPGSEEVAPEERELQRDDLETGSYEGETIDLGDMLREQVVLSLPQYPHCREDCLGLCANCGENLNKGSCKCFSEDKKAFSPFHVLKKLKEDK